MRPRMSHPRRTLVPHRSPAHDPGPHDRAHPVGQSGEFETRQFEVPTAETRRFAPPATQPPAPRPYAPGAPHPAERPPAGHEPLAHEGGLPYGTPPAPAYPPPQQFVPQHLSVPPQFSPGRTRRTAPAVLQPYVYPPQQIQQTVVMTTTAGSTTHSPRADHLHRRTVAAHLDHPGDRQLLKRQSAGGLSRNGLSSSHSRIGSPPAPGAADNSAANSSARSYVAVSMIIPPAMRSLSSAKGP